MNDRLYESSLVSISPSCLQGKQSLLHLPVLKYFLSGKHTRPRQKCNGQKNFRLPILKKTHLPAGSLTSSSYGQKKHVQHKVMGEAPTQKAE